jgi:Zn-dependent peptidase ImmA (M78 family)/transcriptional regulator with XRE-family HTH domain
MTNVAALPDRAAGFVPHRLVEARMARRLSRPELAAMIGVTRQAIGYYEAGERRPDMGMVLKFADALGRVPTFFLHPGPAFGGSQGTRYFRSTGPRSNRLNDSLDVRLKWLWEITTFLGGMVNFPKVDMPPLAIPGDINYSLPEIEHAATQTRRYWGLGDGPIANVIALLETRGAILSRFSMGTERVDAFSSWLSQRPYIVLGSGKQSAVRSRFDAVHELAHLILHRDISQEDLESSETRARIEREANQFAGAFLLPRSSLLGEFYSTRLSHLEGLKRRWRVSMQAIAHRAAQVGVLDEEQYINFRKQMSSKKWLTLEPLDDEIPFEEPSYLRKCWELMVANLDNLRITESGLDLGPDIVSEVTGYSPAPPPQAPEPRLRRVLI